MATPEGKENYGSQPWEIKWGGEDGRTILNPQELRTVPIPPGSSLSQKDIAYQQGGVEKKARALGISSVEFLEMYW